MYAVLSNRLIVEEMFTVNLSYFRASKSEYSVTKPAIAPQVLAFRRALGLAVRSSAADSCYFPIWAGDSTSSSSRLTEWAVCWLPSRQLVYILKVPCTGTKLKTDTKSCVMTLRRAQLLIGRRRISGPRQEMGNWRLIVQSLKEKNPQTASTAPGARSNEGSSSAGAQLNRRNDSEKPSAGKNGVLPSPSRAHDP